jgi:adenosylcobinamide-phosphate synthase
MGAAPESGWWRQFFFGLFMAILVPTVSAAAAQAILRLAPPQVFGLQIIVGALLLKSSFALRELGAAAYRVKQAVGLGNLPQAREALRSLCSRDPAALDEEALLAAAIESVAENVSDSFVAPLFYFVLFGIPGAIAYRAINTLDAMVGYRGRFEALGKVPARLDDVANFVPARLTAMLMLLAGCFLGGNTAGGWRIFRRDRNKTPSPNSGQPMAVMAGLLGVQLDKKDVYVLGDRTRPVDSAMVECAWRTAALTGWLTAAGCALAIVGLGFRN